MDAPKEYPISPLAELFPEMGGEDYGGLVASIREEGLIDPITIWLGHVLDGRHRYRACAEAGVEPRFTVLEDEADPVSYMLARNQVRRHLDDSQRAVVAYKLSAGPTQDEGGANLHNGLNQKQASERLGVSRRSLKLRRQSAVSHQHGRSGGPAGSGAGAGQGQRRDQHRHPGRRRSRDRLWTGCSATNPRL